MYKQMLLRIEEFRIARGLTQDQFGNILGMSQGYYSKIINGSAQFPLEAFRKLAAYSGDIDYFITGTKSPVTELNDYMRLYSGKIVDFLKLCVWTVGCACDVEKQEALSDHSRQIRYLSLMAERNFGEENIWKCVRKSIGITQVKMAEELGIDTKKYRKIENHSEPTKVDAALLVRVYREYGFLPSLLLGNQEALLYEINRKWLTFDPDLKKRMLYFIEQADFLMVMK